MNKNEELQYSDPDNDENVKLEDRVQIRPFCNAKRTSAMNTKVG